MCKNPLARCETFEKYYNKQGGISYKANIISYQEVERNPKYYQNKYRRVDMIPCGQCIECRLQKARDKATQMMLEKKMHPDDECWFITLTYADEYLPTLVKVDEETGERKEGVSLKVKDVQDFMKRLRRHYEYHYGKEINIRYVCAGEYGDFKNSHRPHYHYVMYGLPLDEAKLKYYKHNDFQQPLWKHEELEKLWGKGLVTVGRVTWDSCNYVARYCLDKQFGKNSYLYDIWCCKPEFVIQSTKPPIGYTYYEKNMSKIYHTDSVPIANERTNINVKPPKSFDRQYKKLHQEELEKLKRKRKAQGELIERAKDKQSNLNRQERREQKNLIIEERTKSLKLFRKDIE